MNIFGLVDLWGHRLMAIGQWIPIISYLHNQKRILPINNTPTVNIDLIPLIMSLMELFYWWKGYKMWHACLPKDQMLTCEPFSQNGVCTAYQLWHHQLRPHNSGNCGYRLVSHTRKCQFYTVITNKTCIICTILTIKTCIICWWPEFYNHAQKQYTTY